MDNWKIYKTPPASGGRPKKIILMLHGYGSNGQDLIGLAPHLALTVPNALFLSPDAPWPCAMAPFGRQWFPLQNFDPAYMLHGMEQAAPVLDAFIDSILSEHNLQESDLALLGFSQGTMMSLYLAPRRKSAIAGVLGYSGALLGGDSLSGADISKPPILLIHGQDDAVVPVESCHAAQKILQQHGFPVESITIPGLPHSIDAGGIEAGAAFLKKVLT